MTRKIIVTIDDEETSNLQASYYVMKVIQEGLLSETNKQKHYCFVTEFKNRIRVMSSITRKGSFTFRVMKSYRVRYE